MIHQSGGVGSLKVGGLEPQGGELVGGVGGLEGGWVRSSGPASQRSKTQPRVGGGGGGGSGGGVECRWCLKYVQGCGQSSR